MLPLVARRARGGAPRCARRRRAGARLATPGAPRLPTSGSRARQACGAFPHGAGPSGTRGAFPRWWASSAICMRCTTTGSSARFLVTSVRWRAIQSSSEETITHACAAASRIVSCALLRSPPRSRRTSSFQRRTATAIALRPSRRRVVSCVTARRSVLSSWTGGRPMRPDRRVAGGDRAVSPGCRQPSAAPRSDAVPAQPLHSGGEGQCRRGVFGAPRTVRPMLRAARAGGRFAPVSLPPSAVFPFTDRTAASPGSSRRSTAGGPYPRTSPARHARQRARSSTSHCRSSERW